MPDTSECGCGEYPIQLTCQACQTSGPVQNFRATNQLGMPYCRDSAACIERVDALYPTTLPEYQPDEDESDGPTYDPDEDEFTINRPLTGPEMYNMTSWIDGG